MPKVIFTQVEQCFNPFLLEKGVEYYVNFCKETCKELDQFKDNSVTGGYDYYVTKIISMIQAELDTIASFAESRLVAIHYYWRKLQRLIYALEIALDDLSTYDELENACNTAERIFDEENYIYSRRENYA